MNAEQKYNRIINFIEAEIAKGLNTKARNILLGIKKEFGIESRSLSEIFDFLIGKPIITYIKTRQLMKAAEVILEGGSNQDAIKYTGYNDEPSFIKAFRSVFSVSPGNFKELKNPQIQKSITWSDITRSENKPVDNAKVSAPVQFGIPIDLYVKVREAENIQIRYGFDDEASNVAYKIAERFNVGLTEAFELVDQLIRFFEGRRPFIDDYENWINMYGEIVYFYFKLENVFFDKAVDMFTDLRAKGIKDISKVDFENLSKHAYTVGDTSYLQASVYEEATSECEETSTYGNLDDGEDFFDMYSAYEWRDSYGYDD